MLIHRRAVALGTGDLRARVLAAAAELAAGGAAAFAVRVDASESGVCYKITSFQEN